MSNRKVVITNGNDEEVKTVEIKNNEVDITLDDSDGWVLANLGDDETESLEWRLVMAEHHNKRLSHENAALRDQLHSLFERVSGCEVSEFSGDQVNYLADMIEGQLDANEGCINKVKSENAALREELRLKEAECESIALDKQSLMIDLSLCIEELKAWASEYDDSDSNLLIEKVEESLTELGGSDEQQAD